MQKLILLLAVLLQILYLQATALACTSFLVQDDKRPLMGKSYDWDLGHGIVLVNQRGRGSRRNKRSGAGGGGSLEFRSRLP
jgi:penicillin V acylase-like amidase (Ntn superfamily)